MKVLCISKNGRELVRSPVREAMMLIGRSPICEIVLRAPGVKPVHFILEWVGVGTFDAGEGVWSIIDVATDKAVKESSADEEIVGLGVVLDKTKVSVGGFDFEWRSDRLHESRLEGGSLSTSFMERSQKSVTALSYQLEMVTAREDSGSLTNVRHLYPPSQRTSAVALPGLNELKVTWSASESGAPLSFDLAEMQEAKVYQRGVSLKFFDGTRTMPIRVQPGDLLKVHWHLYDYYFRLVPQVEVPPVQHSLLSDAFQWMTFLAVLLMIAVLSLIRYGTSEPPVEVKPPPRIAQIEIPQEPPPPLPENPANGTEAENVKPPPKPEKKVEEIEPEPIKSASGSKKSEGSPKTKSVAAKKEKGGGLNSVAQKADVNTMGLLGAIKSKNTGTVKADAVLNDGIISKTVSGSQGRIQLPQAPMGVVSGKTSQGGGLSAAYSKMDLKDSATEDRAGSLKAPSHEKNSDIGYSKSSSYEMPDNEFSTKGGLDKESVRRALIAYRKDIATCYDRALITKSKIKGRVTYKWFISAEGPVNWVKIQSATTEAPILESCVQSVIKGIRFPVANNGQATMVIYPFEFLPKSDK